MLGASVIDVDALWHVVLYSFVAVVGLVTAYGTVVFALDRVQHRSASPGERVGWMLALGVGVVICLGLVVVGLWAMTEK
jgi:hypothetical protein